jgi:oxygen-independent coproporphyrinogen III oxidase
MGIYLHIPYCRQACNYCNFHFSVYQGNKPEFLNSLHKEIEMQKGFFGEKKYLESIYFGGGTPSTLAVEEIASLLSTISRYFHYDDKTEITLESNPDDLSVDYLRALKQMTPINRLSIGIQSFHDADLRYMNRVHNSRQATEALKNAISIGFTNLTTDLIYGTPTMDDVQWRDNINRIFALGVAHISAYSLTVEKKTALEVFIRKGKLTPVDEDQSARQFAILLELMQENGYLHYEISNFCKPGMYSRHNLSYWTGKPYLGLGPSAHSYRPDQRWWNISNTCAYIQSIEKGTIPSETEILTPEQQLDEYIMTSLRTMWGCNLDYVEEKWGGPKKASLLENAGKFIQQGKMTFDNNHLILTKEGKLFADGIAGELFF